MRVSCLGSHKAEIEVLARLGSHLKALGKSPFLDSRILLAESSSLGLEIWSPVLLAGRQPGAILGPGCRLHSFSQGPLHLPTGSGSSSPLHDFNLSGFFFCQHPQKTLFLKDSPHYTRPTQKTSLSKGNWVNWFVTLTTFAKFCHVTYVATAEMSHHTTEEGINYTRARSLRVILRSLTAISLLEFGCTLYLTSYAC